MHILRCMGSKFCVKFQRAPLKFHTKFESIHRKICILLFSIFACELRYLWIVTSQALVSRAPVGILNANNARSRLPMMYCSILKSFGKIAQSAAISLACSVQIFQAKWQLTCMPWTNYIMRHLSLRTSLGRITYIATAFCLRSRYPLVNTR